MDWDEIEHNLEFVKIQEDLAQYLKDQPRPLTTREIRLGFGEKFLGDALQTLESTGRIAAIGGVLLPKYTYVRDDVKPEKLRTCYHCGNIRGIGDFINPDTDKTEKICSNCRKYRGRRKKTGS